MTKLQDLRKNTTKIFTVISLSFSAFIIMFVGFNLGTIFAEQTDTINTTRIVSAQIDKVWNIVSDVNKNPDYWPITIVNSSNKTGNTSNTIEREVTVPAPPFMDNKAVQIITINPDKYIIVENQTQGPITGVKTISLNQVESDNNKTEINVSWNLDLSKIPGPGKGFAKDGINKSVDEALNQIEKSVQ